VRFPRALLDQIIEHARKDMPNECCGIVATNGGEAVKVFPAVNVHHSPTRFEIDGRDVIRVLREIEEQGWELGSIYHSHTKTTAYPSQTDVNFAANWPGVVWLIVSLEDRGSPSVRVFEISDGSIDEGRLEITP
jgi:[CysO sulfur-carrier protein]-S-L-cysteine hydrolase